MGGENGITRADFFMHLGRHDEIPNITPPDDGVYLIHYFWDMRTFKECAENRIEISDIKDWQEHTSCQLDRWERDSIISMDRAFSQSMREMLQFHHSTISKIKTEDKNRDRLKNGRRS